MRFWVKKFAFLLKIIVPTAMLWSAANGAIGFYALQTAMRTMDLLPQNQIRLDYDSLAQGACLTSVCLKAKNVSLRFEQLGLDICLGDVMLSKGLFSPYEISLGNTFEKETVMESIMAGLPALFGIEKGREHSFGGERARNCVFLSGAVKGTRDFLQVEELAFRKNGFSASFYGDVDARAQMVRLDGTTKGLADFISAFVHPDMQLMVRLLLSNKEQKVTVRSDETHIKVFGLPLFPKKYVFNQFFKSLSF